jgi:homocysteine S-methyltransferase
VSEDELQEINERAVSFVARLRDEFSANEQPIVLDGIVGSQGDAYDPDPMAAADQAERYHAKQISWLAATDIDMVTGFFPESVEPIGFVRAAHSAGMPAVVSLTLETDGRLHTGQPLQEAIESIDESTDNGAAYFMVHCAHPDHFSDVFDDADWARRIRGFRCNASRKSHAELNEAETLDDGNPVELGGQYKDIKSRMPWVNVVGGCCGTDLRHVTQIARAVAG